MLHLYGVRKMKRIFIFEEMKTRSLRVKNVVIMILYPAQRVEGKDSSLTITLEHKPHIWRRRQEQNLDGVLHWEMNSRRGSQTCPCYRSLYSVWVSHQDSRTLNCVMLSTRSKQIPFTADGGSCAFSKEHLLLPVAVQRKFLKRLNFPCETDGLIRMPVMGARMDGRSSRG